jgi:hypothetical protein
VDDRSAKLRKIERDVEQRIRHMQREGELRGLPGEGRALPADDEGPAESWAARRVMRNAGASPEWVDLRKGIDARVAKLRLRFHAHRQWLHDRTRLLAELPADRILEATHATTLRDARVRGELDAAIGEVNALVRRYDLIVPTAMQLPLVTVEMLEASERRESGKAAPVKRAERS